MFEAALDVVLALAILAVVVRCLVPRRFVLGAGVAGTPAELAPVVLGAFALLCLRVAVARRLETPPGLKPGRWFAGLGAPAVVLAAAFAFVLASRPPTASPMGADEAAYLRQLQGVMLEGRLGEAGVEPGPTLLWAPFYLLAHAIVGVLRLAGFDVAADGWGEPYRNAIRLGSAAWALVAAALAWSLSRRFVPSLLAAVCVAAYWLGSPLFHYTWAEPAMAHAPATALTSLLVWLWLRARDGAGGGRTWVALGLVAGLLVATQRYDAYFLLLPLGSALASVRARTGPRGRWVAFAAGAAVLAALPLALVSLGSPEKILVHPGTAGDVFLSEWRRPHVAEVLFASNGGLFAWTPLALVGVAGLVVLARREPRTALPLLATLAAGILLLASTRVWWGGWSFGARRLTEAYPILALGLSAAGAALLRRPAVLGAAALATLMGLNVAWSHAVRTGAIPQGDATSFANAASHAVNRLYATLGHPFSWPAPWLFAWKHELGPDRFDALFGRAPQTSWDLRIGSAEDAAVLGHGWSRPASDEGGGRFRWAIGPESTLLVTLTAPETRVLSFGAAGCRNQAGAPQVVDLLVNGRLVRRLELRPEPGKHVVVVPRAFWVTGLNEIALASAWQLSPVEAHALREAPGSGFRLDAFALVPAGPAPE